MTSSKPSPRNPIRNIPAPDGTKPSVYGRFIPREELNDFAAWTPGTLDTSSDAAAPGPGASRRPAKAEAPSADQQAELQTLLNTTRQQAYQDGYRDGLAALDAFKQSHARQVATQIGALLKSTGEQLDALQQQMAGALAVSATNLARQIVRTELQTRPGLVAMVATEALDALLLSARHITVRVHPDDLDVVTQGASEVLKARGARVIADSAVARGGCLVDSDIGTVDAEMQTRWRLATAELGAEQPWVVDAASHGTAHEARADQRIDQERRS
ncbi:MAG: FliH/SctL family protein [Ideonella sp.]